MIGSGYERRTEPEAPVGPRVRVYELAKDLGVQPKDLLVKLRAMAIDVANHMSQIDPGEVDRIRRAVDRERHESLVEERLTDTVIRRRSKVVPGGAPPRARWQPRRPFPSKRHLRRSSGRRHRRDRSRFPCRARPPPRWQPRRPPRLRPSIPRARC